MDDAHTNIPNNYLTIPFLFIFLFLLLFIFRHHFVWNEKENNAPAAAVSPEEQNYNARLAEE